MPLQKLPEEAVDTTEEPGNEVWFYAALDTRYHRLAVFIADASGQILYKTDHWKQITAIWEKCGSR